MTKKILSVTTISFDIFVLESLLPLSNGMTIVLADELSQNNPVSLAKLITESGVNVLQMTPSRMKMLVDNEKFCKAIKNIEYILIGGESFPSVLLHQLSHITNATIFNMYGPTETTVWSSMKRLTAKVHITIGRPIHNTEIVILDQYNQMQPIGVPGELCIAGTGLSNGYLNNEILTNDRFVMWHGKKIFKTGDIAFLNPCNEIVCMGRLDNQVKIRGYRIELAEIEEAMMNFRGIVLSAVIVNIDQFDEKYLSAYFEADMEIDLCELKGNLQTILPEYMVPSFFYQVEKIPFTPNLKVDRKRLLEVPCIALNNKIIIRPKNEVQSIILEHWRSFLNVQDIGIKDNFFDIGGDSLKAVQITTQLLDKFDIDANAIFKYPTVVLLEKNINYKSDNFYRYISTQRFYAKKINSIVNDMQYQADYREYMKKNLQICSLDLSSKYNHRNILVTGASGNLGIHLVHELINTSSAHVYLLVRENSSMDAKTRIENLYSKYFGGVEYVENKKRIHIVNANIEYNRLGLDDSFYMDLAQKIDCIFHAAAKVSHYGTYSDFYSINVRGTENLIEFALNGKQIIFNYISTQGIGYRIPNTTHRILFTEFDDVEDLPIENYYLQTKAETENLVKAAGNQGLEYRIYRIGNLFIDSKNGDMPENFLNMSIYRVLRAFMNIGVIPNLSYPIFDFSFIDDVSRAIISLANVTCVTNQVFHVSNSERVLLPQLGAMLKNSCNNCSIIDVEDFFNIVVKNYSMQTYIDEITDLILFFHIPKMFIERTNERTNMILERIGFQWHSLECRHLESIKSAFKSNL